MSKTQPSFNLTPQRSQMTRRQAIRLISATGTMLFGGAVLAGCGGTTSSASITLTTSDWPVPPMPTAEALQKNPSMKGYKQALEQWLKKNPGVTLKSSSIDVWNGEAMSAAVASGTAPSWYGTGVATNSGDEEAYRSAATKGIYADLTRLTSQYELQKRIVPSLQSAFDAMQVNGKYLTVPYDYIASGHCIFYRRDLFQEAGLAEPTANWTWDDFRQIATKLTKDKIKGVAFPAYAIDPMLQSQGWNSLTRIPSPGTNWRWKYDYQTNAASWVQMVKLWRDMFVKDKSVIAQQNSWDESDAFNRGDAAMILYNAGLFTRSPGEANSPAQLAEKLNKPLDDVVGLISVPRGTGGWFGDTQAILSTASLSPYLKGTTLDKAYDLYLYLNFDEGYKTQKTVQYEVSKDLRTVFAGSPTAYDYGSLPGVPGTAEDAWGKKWFSAQQEILNVPLIPKAGAFLPPEGGAGLTKTAFDNARSAWMFTEKDATEILNELQSTTNQQVASLSSTISSEDFKKGARQYYQELDTFWSKHAPDYHRDTFTPWYQKSVQPAIK